MMPSSEEVQDYLSRLTINRQTLQHYLRQKDMHGGAHMPPAITHGIREARGQIAVIKRALSSWNIPFEPHIDDEDTERTGENNIQLLWFGDIATIRHYRK
jgi:hypothetical protein